MASNVYQTGIAKCLGMATAINLLSDTIKVMLLGTGYTPDHDHDFVSDVVANELSGTGYTGGYAGSGRKTLANKSVGVNDATNKALFDADDVTWTAINAGTIGYVVVFKEITNDATSPIIACVDVADIVTNGGNVTIQWDAAGIFNIG